MIIQLRPPIKSCTRHFGLILSQLYMTTLCHLHEIVLHRVSLGYAGSIALVLAT